MTGLEWIAAILMVLGSLLVLLSAIGLIRMPDLYTRLSASSKASSLGAMLILVGFAVTQQELAVISRAFATILFVLITVPVGAHALVRAAYASGVPLWKRTHIDELADRTGLDMPEILPRLLNLEFEGLARQLPGKYYIRNK